MKINLCQSQAQTSLESLRDVSLTQSECQTHTFHLVPSMGPNVSIVTSHSLQNQLQKSRPVSKPVNATVHGYMQGHQCMSVSICWTNKMEQAKCDISVGFPISSHIIIAIDVNKNKVDLIKSISIYSETYIKTLKNKDTCIICTLPIYA